MVNQFYLNMEISEEKRKKGGGQAYFLTTVVSAEIATYPLREVSNMNVVPSVDFDGGL